MAEKKISELDSATSLSSTDTMPVVTSGQTKKATIDQIAASSSFSLPTISASYIASSSSFAVISASYIASSGAFATISSSYKAASGSFASMSASYATRRARIDGTVVLSVSGSNSGDIRLTGAIYASSSVYRRINVRTISTNGPILPTDQILFISCTANLVLTATSPAFNYEPILIKKIVPNSFTIQVARAGSELIEGVGATYTLTGSEQTTYPGWTLMTDGTNHWVG